MWKRDEKIAIFFFFFVEKVKLGYRTKAWTIIRQSREVCLLQFENTVAQKSSVHRLLYISVWNSVNEWIVAFLSKIWKMWRYNVTFIYFNSISTKIMGCHIHFVPPGEIYQRESTEEKILHVSTQVKRYSNLWGKKDIMGKRESLFRFYFSN